LNPAEDDDIGFLILEANSPTTLSFSPRNVGSAWIPGEKDRPPAMSGLLVRDRSVRGLLGLPGGALPGSFAIILMIMIISCRLLYLLKKNREILHRSIKILIDQDNIVYVSNS